MDGRIFSCTVTRDENLYRSLTQTVFDKSAIDDDDSSGRWSSFHDRNSSVLSSYYFSTPPLFLIPFSSSHALVIALLFYCTRVCMRAHTYTYTTTTRNTLNLRRVLPSLPPSLSYLVRFNSHESTKTRTIRWKPRCIARVEYTRERRKARNGRPSLYHPAKVLVKGKRYRYAKQRDCPLLFSPRGNTNDDNDNDNDNDNENDNGNDNDSDSRPKRFLRSDPNCFSLSLCFSFIYLSIRLSLSRSLRIPWKIARVKT